ncbi:cytochrome P450 4c3-like isoform X1 [Pieris brassicae]|uniref:cytochrome P450 4c3-like isoform X1 n=2 Tax=Pieris brassicae TaxID=7116 RepID=UPI001E65F802|nr:cytochrome P450 4c3-like isoform X1 [Pieris brassicae]
MLIILFVCVIVIIYYAYFRWSRKAIYDFSETLPNVGSLPVLGHTHWFIGGPERLFNNIKHLGSLLDKSPSTINKVWIGPSLYIVPFNPEDIQKILDNCLQKDSSYRFLRAWLGNGLFVAPVELWRMHRKLLLTVFHNRIIEDYINIFGEQGTFLVKRLQENIGQHEFDVFKFVTSCTLDIVFETAMGKKMDVQNNSDTPYLRARNVVMSIISMRLFKAWLRPEPLFNMTSYSKIQKENIDYTHKFTDEVVTEKRASFNKNGRDTTKGRKDLLELLLERNANFTDAELREHIDSITIAGNDTTAHVISYVLLILGSHKREQDTVFEELQSIFGDSMRSPTKEDLNKMEYLERVIKETMRLYTVVPIIGRETQKELKLSTCTVPAGVGCAILPFILHRSKKIWGPDAEDFNPDRFLPENSVNRHPCSFIPFSYGARNCIGRHFGMLGMKSILANVLRSYKVSSNICNRLKIEILLIPVSGHLITIEKRI